ncbi:MAG: aminotransferase class IV [Fuerstiella sp.]|nr:aminotransferase class IV [Fuerstiella sp.]
MSARLVYLNGKFVPECDARVSIFDSALMYGDMAFEMTRTFNHKPFRLREHLDRLYGSLRLLEIDCGLSIDEMEKLTRETLERNIPTEADDMDWQIMHDVSRGPLPLYSSAFGAGVQPTVSINCWPLITHTGGFANNYRTGVEIMIPAQQTIPAHLLDLKAKTRSRVHYRMAELQGQRAGGRWPVLLDPDGFLAEGPGWNIFLVRNGVIFTPEPRNVLNGVSRNATIEFAGIAGIEVRETNLGRYEALTAEEIFCTATTYSLVHATSFEGQTVGDGRPGPVFHTLLNTWKDQVGIDFVAQALDYAPRVAAWQKNDAKSAAQA